MCRPKPVSVSGLLDSGTQQVTWDTTIGLGSQQQSSRAVAQGGGLTTEEHGWLDTVQTWISNTTHLGGRIVLQSPVGALLVHPDIGRFMASSPCSTRLGIPGLAEPNLQTVIRSGGAA
jgi:hypothetical protein